MIRIGAICPRGRFGCIAARQFVEICVSLLSFGVDKCICIAKQYGTYTVRTACRSGDMMSNAVGTTIPSAGS
jgi:hypothetical protein